MEERRPLSRKARLLLVGGVLLVLCLVAATVLVLRTRSVNAKKRTETLAVLAELGDNILLAEDEPSANGSYAAKAVDGWGQHVRVLTKGADYFYYSVGVNGVDEQGRGDDLSLGDVAWVTSTR